MLHEMELLKVRAYDLGSVVGVPESQIVAVRVEPQSLGLGVRGYLSYSLNSLRGVIYGII